jgi:hypothetical protein
MPNSPTKRPRPAGAGGGPPRFCTQYVNRWGQLMVASRYGYKAWPFR